MFGVALLREKGIKSPTLSRAVQRHLQLDPNCLGNRFKSKLNCLDLDLKMPSPVH